MLEFNFLLLSMSILYILTHEIKDIIANPQNQQIYSTTSPPRAGKLEQQDNVWTKAITNSDTRRLGSNTEIQHLTGLHAKLQKVKELASGQRNNYELSPSTISSIYNFINGKTDKSQPSSTKAPDTKPASLIGDSHLLNQPIALGSEPDVFSRPQQNDASNYLQLGPTFSPESISALTQNDIISESPKVFNKPILTSDEQIFNSLYMNDFHNHQLLNQPPQQLIQQRKPLYTRQASNLNEAQQHFYNAPNYFPIAQNTIRPPRSRYSNPQPKPKVRRLPNLPMIHRKSPPPFVVPERKKRKNMLTNEQLVSLIDELKEFNSRQASKIQAQNVVYPLNKGVKLPKPEVNHINRASQRAIVQDVGGSIQDKTTPSSEPEKFEKSKENASLNSNDELNPPSFKKSEDDSKLFPEEDQHKDDVEEEPKDNKMSSDDLTKFAQFLMTKKGADLKFQLGLDKDAKDDGDEEDDHDVLLESKKKPRKAKPKDRLLTKLEELNNQHEMVASKMGSMIDSVTSQRKPKTKAVSRGKNFDDDKSRSRRDHSMYSGQHTVKEVETEEKLPHVEDTKDQSTLASRASKPKPPIKVNEEENLAKMLIKQEILEDQREHNQDPPTPKKVIKYDKKQQQQPNSSPSSVSGDVFAETNLPISRAEQGEKNYEYPKSERSDDREALREELQKTRKKKSDTRTRIPMAMDDIIQRALDGELGLSTVRQPDGQIVFKDSKDGALATMKVPKKSTNKETVAIEEPDNGNNQQQSEHITTQEAPQNQNGTEVLDSVRITSQKPVQDEYPISEKVSDRLNKLSNNLDRYFNDGFLREVESKTGLNDGDVDSHLPQSSNVNTAETVERPTKKDVKKDEDFDVDITIDGKKDVDRDEDEDEYKDNDKHIKMKDKTASPSDKRRRKTHSTADKRNGGQTKLDKSNKGDKSSTPGKKGKNIVKNIKIEHHEGSHPSLDPVDSESLETPIGPDGEETDNPNVTAKTKVKSTRGTNVSSNYSKTKFFEEPEWNAR